jgi:hypothetical protein
MRLAVARPCNSRLFRALAGRVMLVTSILVLPPTTAVAQSSPPPASPASLVRYRLRVLGVFDEATGEPVEGAEVGDILTGASALTTKTGTVSLFFLPDGGGLVRIRKLGYASTSLAVRISPADTVPITILLTRAVELPAVVTRDSAVHHTSPGMRGFDERQRAGFGHFVTEAELRKADDRKLGDVIRARVPGLVLVPGAGGAAYMVAQRNCQTDAKRGPCSTPRCYVHVYLDGALIDNGDRASLRTDFSRMDVNQLGGVEYYADGASVPVQYSTTGADCGVLLLWER